MRIFFIGFFLLAAGMFYVAYKASVSIPYEYVENVKSLQSRVDRQESDLAKQIAKFEELQASAVWAFLEAYSNKQQWPEALLKSKRHLAAAKTVLEDTIDPILERDHEDDLNALIVALNTGQEEIKASREQSILPLSRAKLILENRANKDKYFQDAKQFRDMADKKMANLKVRSESLADKYPHQQEALQKKVEVGARLFTTVQRYFSVMDQEYKAPLPDYALYGDSYLGITKTYEELQNYSRDMNDQFSLLDRSYVKVLADQKVDFYVAVGRADWCESDYCGSGDQMRYPASKVDANTFEYFSTLTLNTIADEGAWSGFDLKIPQSRWQALKIDKDFRRSSGNDYAEFWVDSTFEKTYHRYTIIEDGKVTEGDWVEVAGALFWKHYDNLGMAIESKPLGYFEQEMITEAEPVGMAMIAEPTMVNGVATGSNQYGEWRQSNGTSFWHYYGMYRMFGDVMGGNRYSYNDWNGYHKNARRSPYYGNENQYGTFGSGTYSHSRYKNSDFLKRNPSVVTEARTGRSRKANSSIRGAGPSGRSKGPSSGGK
ncbi:hypothetical protein ACMXYV_06140 [Neptuniibacter sp. SY11_33]|uniref:hypothetical protein n=1 Tax=Neptuniibacter sp. SY11_33 TaxID=3398215 RepID=UPI0039F5D3DD